MLLITAQPFVHCKIGNILFLICVQLLKYSEVEENLLLISTQLIIHSGDRRQNVPYTCPAARTLQYREHFAPYILLNCLHTIMGTVCTLLAYLLLVELDR